MMKLKYLNGSFNLHLHIYLIAINFWNTNVIDLINIL